MTIIHVVGYALTSIILLFLDVVTFSIFEYPCVHLVLAYYLAYILSRDNVLPLAFVGTTLAAESVLLYSRFGLMLAYVIPVSCIGLQMAQAVSARVLVYTAMIISCFVIQHHLVDPFILARETPSIPYTIRAITATLIVGLLFLLKLKDGRQGNRF